MFHDHSTAGCWQQVDPGMIWANSHSKQAQRHTLRIGSRVAASPLIGDEQRAVGQFERLAVGVTIVYQKAVVFSRGDPCLATIGTEDDP